MTLLSLVDGIVYGPVSSRRFGRSLGLNLMPPDRKVCPLNCLYCHFGWTTDHVADASELAAALPTPSQVAGALDRALERAGSLDAITFSGNGEPTLHPDFPEIVNSVRDVRDRRAPTVPVQILSNSATLQRPEVLDALRSLDRRVMKLDAGTQETFGRINRPLPGSTLRTIVEGLRSLGGVTIQTALMTGGADNCRRSEVTAWLEQLKLINPIQVQLYTLDRPTADSGLVGVARERMHQIAEAVAAAWFDVRVF